MIIRSEDIRAYHDRQSLSKSKLGTFDRFGAAHYHAQYIAKTMPGPDSPALWFGRRFDGLCDNEDRERNTWAPPLPEDAPKKPSSSQRNAKKPSPETVAAIAWWDEWNAKHGGKVEVGEDDRQTLLEMMHALDANEHAHKLWSHEQCERQLTIRRELPALGIELQSRPDGVNLTAELPYIADIKTTADLSRFPNDCITYGYHMQLAIGQWLLAKEGVQAEAYLIVVESKRAPRCKVFRMPEIALAAGWEKAKRLMDEIARRMKANDWTERQESIEEITLPGWQLNKLENAQ